jgi:hypothetical protein
MAATADVFACEFAVKRLRCGRAEKGSNSEEGTMKLQFAGPCLAFCVVMLSGCVPRIELAAPKEPITINMNVKIEHEIHIKVDKDVEDLLKNQSDLF